MAVVSGYVQVTVRLWATSRRAVPAELIAGSVVWVRNAPAPKPGFSIGWRAGALGEGVDPTLAPRAGDGTSGAPDPPSTRSGQPAFQDEVVVGGQARSARPGDRPVLDAKWTQEN